MMINGENVLAVTAAEARMHIAELEVERATALASGLAEIPSYKRDLDEEIDVWRYHLVGAAVTEIATLRAELSGPNVG